MVPLELGSSFLLLLISDDRKAHCPFSSGRSSVYLEFTWVAFFFFWGGGGGGGLCVKIIDLLFRQLSSLLFRRGLHHFLCFDRRFLHLFTARCSKSAAPDIKFNLPASAPTHKIIYKKKKKSFSFFLFKGIIIVTQRQMPNGYRHSTISGSEIISPKTISGVFRVQRFCLFHLIVFWHIQKNQFLVASWWWCHILPFDSHIEIYTQHSRNPTQWWVWQQLLESH